KPSSTHVPRVPQGSSPPRRVHPAIAPAQGRGGDVPPPTRRQTSKRRHASTLIGMGLNYGITEDYHLLAYGAPGLQHAAETGRYLCGTRRCSSRSSGWSRSGCPRPSSLRQRVHCSLRESEDDTPAKTFFHK